MKMIKNLLLLFVIIVFGSCSKSEEENTFVEEKQLAIKSCDLSFLPQIRLSDFVCKNLDGETEDMLITLKNQGVNTIRLRIWNNPSDGHSGFEEVKNLAQEIKNKGLKVWITVHYSDSWADPAKQTKPEAWSSANYEELKNEVYNYTKTIVTQINPDYIQIGNEINSGFLWPEGNITNKQNMIGLLASGIKAVRDNSQQTKIMLHYAGYENANAFYSDLSSLDYDIIALSYYPFWHGKNLMDFQSKLNILGTTYNKDIVIAETSYPFTFEWNDFTNNIIGSQDQILSEFPATAVGQKAYLNKIKEIMLATNKGIGFSYWGGEWIAFKGNTATNGSSYENQALWDFNNQALPVITVFKN